MKRSNEQNAIDALIKIIPFLLNERYEKKEEPDEKNQFHQDVDWILEPESEESKSPLLAVEHTVVEAFRGQMSYVIGFYNLVNLVNSRCKDQLPPDRYFILVAPHDLVNSLNGREIQDEFAKSISYMDITDLSKTPAR